MVSKGIIKMNKIYKLYQRLKLFFFIFNLQTILLIFLNYSFDSYYFENYYFLKNKLFFIFKNLKNNDIIDYIFSLLLELVKKININIISLTEIDYNLYLIKNKYNKYSFNTNYNLYKLFIVYYFNLFKLYNKKNITNDQKFLYSKIKIKMCLLKKDKILKIIKYFNLRLNKKLKFIKKFIFNRQLYLSKIKINLNQKKIKNFFLETKKDKLSLFNTKRYIVKPFETFKLKLKSLKKKKYIFKKKKKLFTNYIKNLNIMLVKYFLLRLINIFIKKGKRAFIENIIYDIILKLNRKFKNKALLVLNIIIRNIMPIMSYRSILKKTFTKYIPIIIKESTSINIAVNWIYLALKNVKKFNLKKKLYIELIKIYKKHSCLSIKEKIKHYKILSKNVKSYYGKINID